MIRRNVALLGRPPRIDWSVQTSATIDVKCFGNSRTAGQGGTPYPSYLPGLAPLLGPQIAVSNLGHSSAPISVQAATAGGQGNNNLTYHLTSGDNLIGNLSLSKTTIVCVQEMINELLLNFPNTGSGPAAVASCMTAIKSLCLAIRAGAAQRGARVRIIAATDYPAWRTYGNGAQTDSGAAVFNADVQAVNSRVRAEYGSFADALSDLAADTGFTFANYNAATFDANPNYSDRIHGSSAGYSRVASIEAASFYKLMR